jgi:hypothetical protein
MNKKKLNEEFNILTNEEIQCSNDIAQALALINQEGCINDDPLEEKKFIVEKNKDIKALTSKASFEEKNEFELDEMSKCHFVEKPLENPISKEIIFKELRPGEFKVYKMV